MSDRNENRPGYKKTKVGWIPEEWEVSSIGVQKPFVTSGSRGWAKYYCDQGHLFLRITNLTRDSIQLNLDNKKFVKLPKDLGEAQRTRVYSGDILISITAELGVIGFVDKSLNNKAYVNQHISLVRFSSLDIESRYIAYYLSCYESQRRFRGITDQGAKAGLNLNAIRNFLIVLPNVLEQGKIAEILSTWDQGIEQLRKLHEAKKHLKKALMQQLLTGRKRFKGFGAKWKTIKLGDIFSERIECNPNLPLLSITSDRGVIYREETDRKDASNADKSKYKVIRIRDVGYNTMRMWQGVSAVSDLEGIVSPAYTICTPKGTVDIRFMGYFFKFSPVVNLFYRFSQGLVSDTLNLKFHNFVQIKVKIPCFEEQQAISNILRIADDEVKELEAKLKALEKQKRGLMQKLLTGEVRVSL